MQRRWLCILARREKQASMVKGYLVVKSTSAGPTHFNDQTNPPLAFFANCAYPEASPYWAEVKSRYADSILAQKSVFETPSEIIG